MLGLFYVLNRVHGWFSEWGTDADIGFCYRMGKGQGMCVQTNSIHQGLIWQSHFRSPFYRAPNGKLCSDLMVSSRF